MKRMLLGLVCLSTIITLALLSVANAADMPLKAPPLAPPQVYSWTGFYIGGNAGYGWGNANDAMQLGGSWPTDGTGDNLVLSPLGNGQLHPSSAMGGVQSGYNYQAGQWVMGIEADANYFALKDQFSRSVTNALSGDSYMFASSFESDWLVTVRPRVGYAIDRLLVYATGGLAIANQKFSQSIMQLNLPFTEAGSVSKTSAGWTVGAGAGYALNNQWSLKTEYLYVDAGSVSFSTIGICGAGLPAAVCSGYTAAHAADLKENIVRVGLNLKLN
jgi:outer membrane immunogenic protein